VAGSIDQKTWTALEIGLSADRLSVYVHASDRDCDRAIARYLWNCALCESLYPIVHAVEVAVRNTIDVALSRRFGSSWHQSASFLGPRELQSLTDAVNKLAKRGKVVPTRGDVVAEVNFGFWVSLFSRYYEGSGRLWPALSRDVMSGAPRWARTRQEFQRRLHETRDLRNRVFHHEPVWHWSDLARKHAEAHETLGWLSPEFESLAEKVDRFSTVRARGIDAYEGLLEGAQLCPIHNIACRWGNGGTCPSEPAEE